jgi:leucyl-tRNA synthetase
LRYIDPKNSKAFAGEKKLKYWTPVDWYNGGFEHTTLHLLYSRFWHKFLYDLKLVPTSEPYMKRTSHGIILAENGEKMSKSRGNVINPDTVVQKFGADTLRLYEMFMGPFDQAVAWSTDGIVGPRRFLERIWVLQDKVRKNKNEDFEFSLHLSIKKVTEDIEAMKFNTAISTLMILVNDLDKKDSISRSTYEGLLKLLAPFVPHIVEELWSILGNKKSIHTEKWPDYDINKVDLGEVTFVVQINGKMRGQFHALKNIPETEAMAMANRLPEIQKYIAGQTVKKTIFVPGRLINIVV